MRNTQQGFTLIELVVVIVILGILAATALPKFIDMSGEASQAAVDGVAGALSSASAINYAAKKAGTAAALNINTTPATVCTNAILGPLLQNGVMTPDYIASGTDPCAVGAVVSCTITGSNSKTATASIVCTN